MVKPFRASVTGTSWDWKRQEEGAKLADWLVIRRAGASTRRSRGRDKSPAVRKKRPRNAAMDSFFRKLSFFSWISTSPSRFFHTFCDIFEQTSLVGGEASGQRFFKGSRDKFTVNIETQICRNAAVYLNDGKVPFGMEETLSSECKAFNHLKRYRKVYLNINVYICKDIYRFNMWFLSSKA